LEEQLAAEKQKLQELQKKQAQSLVRQEKENDKEGRKGEANAAAINDLKKKLEEAESERARFEKDVVRLRSQVSNQDKADARIADLSKELQQARKDLTEEKRVKLDRKTEKERENLAVGSVLDAARSEIASLKERLESALKDKVKGIQDLKGQVNDATELVSKAQGDLNSERQQRIQAQHENKKLSLQVRSLEEQRVTMQQDLEATQAMLNHIPQVQATADTPIGTIAPQSLTAFNFGGLDASPQLQAKGTATTFVVHDRTPSIQPPPTPARSTRVHASPVIAGPGPQVVPTPPVGGPVGTPSARRPSGTVLLGGGMPRGGSMAIPTAGSVTIPVSNGANSHRPSVVIPGGSVSIPVANPGMNSFRPPVLVKGPQIVGTMPVQQVFGGPMKDLKGNVQIKVKAIRRIK
jgi:hypothetical protein